MRRISRCEHSNTGLLSRPRLRLHRGPEEEVGPIMSCLDEPQVDPMVDRLEEPVEGAGLPNRSGSLEGRRLMVAQEEALEVDQRLVQLI